MLINPQSKHLSKNGFKGKPLYLFIASSDWFPFKSTHLLQGFKCEAISMRELEKGHS